MSDLALESLLAPLSADAPCGENLWNDPAFLALREAGAGRAEQQFGPKVIPALPPDWRTVHQRALELAARTRDLRVAVWLVRSAARVEGVAGVVQGLQLLHGLVARHWQNVHPQLDASDDGDPTARVNAISSLTLAQAGLADLRAAGLTGERGSLTLRDIELAVGRAKAHVGETVQTEGDVLKGLSQTLAERPTLFAATQAAWAAVTGLQAMFEAHVPASSGPEFGPLAKLMGDLALAARRAQGEHHPSNSMGPAMNSPMPTAPVAAPGVIATREDAIGALERAADWIERNEPGNPAPLLIRRSQRLMSKSFIDIVRDLLPEGVGQIEKLAGVK